MSAVIGSMQPWTGGPVGAAAECVLAPNPSAMTLDGTNTWILAAPGSATAVVVDPGPDDPEHLRAVDRRIGASGRQVVAVLLTHGHLDHSAGAGMFAEHFDVPVLARDPRLTTSPVAPEPESGPARAQGEVLEPGEVLELAGLRIEVIPTPGHTSDSVSFAVLEHDLILTGDTVLGRGTTVVAHPDGSLTEYLASLRLLQALVAGRRSARILPAHGPVVTDPAGLVGQYLSHRRERLDQVRDAIAAGAAGPMDVVEAVYQPIPDEVIPAALASVRAQWDYLLATE